VLQILRGVEFLSHNILQIAAEIAHIDPTATRFTFEKMLSFIDRLHADALADDGCRAGSAASCSQS
jgi:hypothetical protein